MKKLSPNIRKIFNYARDHEGLSVYELAKALELDYKNTHQAVTRAESMGLVHSELLIRNNKPYRLVRVLPELRALSLDRVYQESGARLLQNKEQRRKRYFKLHGSMSLDPLVLEQSQVLGTPTPSAAIAERPLLALRKKPFIS